MMGKVTVVKNALPKLIFALSSLRNPQKVSEYDQEIPQSHTADKPTAQ